MLTYRLRRRDENDYYGARREYSRGYYEPEAYTQYGDEGHDEGDGSSLADRARDRARNLTGRAREGAGELSDKARYAADRTREQVSRVSGEVRDRARRAGGGVRDTFYSNPLAVGAAVLAAGAALGLAVPTSRAEREYMGEARDQFVDKAESAARDAMDKVRNVAREAGRTAQEEAKNQGLTGS